MTSPALRNKQRKLAALQGAATTAMSHQYANAYELVLMQLIEHKRRLKTIESIERKIEAKRGMLADFIPWVQGVLDADSGRQDDVLVTIMLWTLDVGLLADALPLARYVIHHGLDTPDSYERKAATLIAEEVADTSAKQLAAGDVPDAALLLEYVALLTHSDMFDQVRAKLFKSTALALQARAADGDKPHALALMKRAVELHDKVGCKKDIELLERELRKEAKDATAPSGDAAPESTGDEHAAG